VKEVGKFTKMERRSRGDKNYIIKPLEKLLLPYTLFVAYSV